MIGETLGRYQIIEHLGHGGMAEVYKAYQPNLDRYVAVKVLHPFLATEENFLTRFEREAKAVAALRHPNIIQVYDFEYDAERRCYYMVMEFIDGPSLKVRLQELEARGERMPLEEAVRIVVAVGEALDYAHRRGMVHRDVKPANIMFTSDNQVILTDFGIAKIVNVTGLTASGAMVGTPAYISPEQGMGEAGDERSDIYSLGVVFYQLLTGKLPFDADTPMGIVLKHINEPLPSPRSLRPDLPPGLEQVLLRALAKDPDRRYQTAAHFVADLRRVLAGEVITPFPFQPATAAPSDQTVPAYPTPSGLETIPSWGTPPPPPRRRKAWLRPLLIALLFLSLLGGGWLLAYTGRLDALLGSLVSPTPPASTPTPDLAVTQLAATLAAFQATIGAPTSTPTPSPTPTPTLTPTPDRTATAMATCVFDAELVEDIPLRSPIRPGQVFTKRWVVRNSGTCPWEGGVVLAFVSGERMGGAERVWIGPVAPGEEQPIVLELEAPAAYGTYSGVWQLRDERGNPLGEELEVSIRVAPPPATVQPSATPMPQPAVTPTPSPRLWMSQPALVTCFPGTTGYRGGRIGWSAGGGPSTKYRYFYGAVTPQQELSGPYNDFSGFPHAMTYFTTSGEIAWPVPDSCCPGDYGWWRAPEGYEVVWYKVLFVQTNCP